MKTKLLFLLAITVGSVLPGYGQSDLNAVALNLQQAVSQVQTASYSYETKVEMPQPGLIRYSYDEISAKKGDRTSYAYEFNLADIDPYAVREETKKDAIYTVMTVRNKQKLVKVYKNNEVQAYSTEVMMIAKDIENARALADFIKKGIPLAEKALEGRLSVSGYDAMTAWLASNVKEVSLGTTVYAQSLSLGEKPGSLSLKVVESTSKGSKETIYNLNLADVDVNSMNYKIAGSNFAVVMTALQKAKYFEERSGDALKYVNEIAVNVNNVDEARDLKTVFTKTIPLAVDKVNADLPSASTEKDALKHLKTFTVDLPVGSKQVSQSMTDACYCSFTQTEQDSKSTTTNVYKFNWMDFNPNASEIGVSGDKMYLSLAVNDNAKMIMHTINDKFDGYTNSLSIYMPGIENARRAKAVVNTAIEKCRSSYKEPFGSDPQALKSWIMANIKDVQLEDVTQVQKLEDVEGSNEKLKFSTRQVTSKGPGPEEIYEFSLSDMNPQSVTTEVKGDWMYVSAETTYKNKIINFYKDGKIQPYAYKISFALNDTELARNFMSALKKAIETVKK